MASDMDPRDKDTMKWLGDIIEVGGESNKSERAKDTGNSAVTSAGQASSKPITAKAASPRPNASQRNSQSSFARSAALGAVGDSRAPDFRKYSGMTPSPPRNSSKATTPSRRVSQAAASDANRSSTTLEEVARKTDDVGAEVLADPIVGTKSPARYGKSIQEVKRYSTKSTANTVQSSASRRSSNAANMAATMAVRDSTPYQIPEHRLSVNAGKAALLAHQDHREYQVPAQKLAKDAGRAATLAHKDHVEYEVPEHELSANAGKAALLAAHDHVDYEVPTHELSKNASTAALQAHNKPIVIDAPVHELSANASNAAMLAHRDPVNTDIPVHQLSASAGKAALLAHQDHEEYVIPEHEMSANAGKAALLAHRDSKPVKTHPNASSAAGAASALKAATQAHADPAMRPTKPEDLQAKGAANALKAASQAHRDRQPHFKYVHPSDDPEIGKLARSNAEKYLSEMEYRTPQQETIDYANISFANAKMRTGQSPEIGASDEAYRSAGLSYSRSRQSIADPGTQRSRAGTSASNASMTDLMVLARKNVDAQMAARGMTRSDSQATVRTSKGAASTGANLAFKDGQERAIESERQREASKEELEITERINREMAKFDQQRKQTESSTQMQSALMAAAKRNARLSMANMEANRPYSAPNLRDTARMEDLLNAEKLKSRRESNNAQVDIGGGHYMSQADIELVAAKRIQPVFDEMDQHVAEINRRKAELKAKKEAEEAKKAADKAEKRKENELRKERERNTKEAEKKAKLERKAREKADAEKKKAEEKAAADERKAEREAQKAKEKADLEAKQAQAEKLKKTDSTEAVAAAQATSIASPSVENPSLASKEPAVVLLPGTNAALPGQEESSSAVAEAVEVPVSTESEVSSSAVADATPEPASVGASSSVEKSVSADEEFHLAAPLDSSMHSTGEPVATYQIENRGMNTDTEGETDDEWVDASDETPAIERAEYVNIHSLTDSNLIAHGGKRASIDAETASNATAKPGKLDPEDAPPTPTLTPAQLVFVGKSGGHETATRFKEDLTS